MPSSHEYSWAHSCSSSRSRSVAHQSKVWIRLLQDAPSSLHCSLSSAVSLVIMGARSCVPEPILLTEVLELCGRELRAIVTHQFQQYSQSHKHTLEPINNLTAGCCRWVGYFNVPRVIVRHYEKILTP